MAEPCAEGLIFIGVGCGAYGERGPALAQKTTKVLNKKCAED